MQAITTGKPSRASSRWQSSSLSRSWPQAAGTQSKEAACAQAACQEWREYNAHPWEDPQTQDLQSGRAWAAECSKTLDACAFTKLFELKRRHRACQVEH